MMEWGAATVLLLGGVGLLMLLGLPVALAFLGLNLVGAALFLGGPPGLVQLARNSIAAVTNFALTPIPLFVLMGEVLFHTGVALKAITAIERIIRRVPGRLAVVAIVAGTIFSAISGSTIATTALLGSLMLPEMLKRGYEPRFAMGPIMGIGGVDMLIPPSALAVLLGMVAILLILGCFVDQVSMMLITLPLFMPLVQSYAIDPIWFGVIFLICMQLGLLTPPFGLLLFTMKGVSPPGITMGQVYRAAMPYVWIGLAVLALIIAVPAVATLAPRLLFR